MGNVNRHQRTGRERCKEPQGCNRNRNNDRGRRSDVSFLPRLGSLGKFTTLGQNIGRCNPLKQLYTQEQNQQVIYESNPRNEAGDELNGTQKVACGACSNQSRVPVHARMLKRKIENMRFFLELLRLLLPAHYARTCTSCPDGVCPGLARTRVVSRVERVAFHGCHPSYEFASCTATGKSDLKNALVDVAGPQQLVLLPGTLDLANAAARSGAAALSFKVYWFGEALPAGLISNAGSSEAMFTSIRRSRRCSSCMNLATVRGESPAF